MKTLTVVLVVTVLVIHISGYLIQVPIAPSFEQPKEFVSVQSWLQIQKLLTPLFENVCDENKDLISPKGIAIKSGDYSKPDAVTNLEKLIAAGLLPKGEIFSEYNPEHMKELKIIYELLSSARDLEAFYQAAVWARLNLNCGLYVNALYLAIQNRKDTEKFSIPAPYEVLPNYFIRKEVLVKASSILAGQEINPADGIRDEGNAYYLDANYTAMFYDNDDESKLAYFREDIGLNSYYFLRKLRLSPWFNDDINGRYGENLYQMMKQFTARYNLERYANGFPELESFSWNSLPDIQYDPELVYSDGNEFSHRNVPLDLPINEETELLQTIENNVLTVVGHMRQSGYNKTQILNHLMEILVTGERSYETLARQLLGKDRTSTNNRHVSVLEHYMTSLRDPMFWKINKKIVDIIDSALKLLPTYSRNELYFPGVKVVNIDVKKMMTAYDYFEFDVTDALKLDDSKSTFNVKIGQPRLNHKPFTVKLNISSLVAKQGLVKIYLGPKLMPGELAAKKNLFTLLDVFEINLKIGTNLISRSSDDMKHFASDFMSLKTIRQKIEDAEYGFDSMPLKMIESQIGYPTRLILPKGSPQGLPIQMFVFIAPFIKADAGPSYSTSNMEFNSAILSPGYPLDLIIEDRQLFSLPNALIKYVTVTQKGDSKVENYGGPGVTKQWYGTNTYDASSRPNYSQNNKKPFDYHSKKGFSVNSENDPDTNKELSTTADEYLDNHSVIPLKEHLIPDTVFDETTTDGTARSLSSMKLDTKPYYYDQANKAKFDKKDSFGKNIDYSEYHTKALKENDTSPSIATPTYEYITSDIENQENIVANTPRLLKAANYDYSSRNGREPFDYRAKKAQFDKKDYSAKRGDYSKYHTVTPVVEEITIKSTITTPITENGDDKTENEVILTVNTPRLLNSSKFDYSSKRKEFDYKAKKAQFEKKDYSAKRGDYSTYHTVTPVEEEITVTSTITTPINEIGDDETESKDIFTVNTPRLLKSSKFDYSSKRKEFDYKAKKAQFEKKDYSAKRGDYTKYRTVTPQEDEVTTASIPTSMVESIDDLARVQLDKDTNNLDLVSEIKNNDVNVVEHKDLAFDDNIDSNNMNLEPFYFDVRKRTPTVYDFLFHTFDYEDNPELKVYE